MSGFERFKQEVPKTLTLDSLRIADLDGVLYNLKLEIFALISKHYRMLEFVTIENVNNFNFKDFSTYLVSRNYEKESNDFSHYSFSNLKQYEKILDFVIVYSQQVAKGNFAKHTIVSLLDKPLTEILMLKKEEIESLGLDFSIDTSQLSKDFRSNPLIRTYLVESGYTLVDENYLSDYYGSKSNIYFKYAEIILKMIKKDKVTYLETKNRMFLLTQCLNNMKFKKEKIQYILEDLNSKYNLKLSEQEIQTMVRANTYFYKEDTLKEKLNIKEPNDKDLLSI